MEYDEAYEELEERNSNQTKRESETITDSGKGITKSFIFLSFLISFFFGNIIFLIFLFLRIIYSKEQVKKKLEILIGDIYEKHYIFNMDEENKLDVFILGVLNISIISSFFFFLASINHFFEINPYNWIYATSFSILFIFFIFFYKKIFFFFFGLENNLIFIKKKSVEKEGKIKTYKSRTFDEDF